MAYISQVMKSLILHPQDPTTSFLSQIYEPLTNKTIIRGCISKSVLRKLIESHDRVLMLGHGSPYGLLNRSQFPDAGLYIIDDSMVLLARTNPIARFNLERIYLTGAGTNKNPDKVFVMEK